MGAIRDCERGDELDGRVVAVFDSIVAAESSGADKSETVFLAFAFCAAVYGADRTVVVNVNNADLVYKGHECEVILDVKLIFALSH